MKISIITAVFNRARTIPDALQRLRSQTHSDVEHVIIDGGSTDGTLAVIAEHASSRAVVVSEPDDGIYDALNKGISRATGTVVGVLHSDDVFASDGVLARVAEIFSDDRIDAVYGDLDYVRRDDPARIVRRWRSGPFAPARLRYGWMPPHPALFLRREVIDRLGGYDTSFRIAGDYDAILRYFSSEGFQAAYLPEVMVRMRLGGESNRSIGRVLQKSREDYRAIRRNNVGGLHTLACKNLRKVHQFL